MNISAGWSRTKCGHVKKIRVSPWFTMIDRTRESYGTGSPHNSQCALFPMISSLHLYSHPGSILHSLIIWLITVFPFSPYSLHRGNPTVLSISCFTYFSHNAWSCAAHINDSVQTFNPTNFEPSPGLIFTNVFIHFSNIVSMYSFLLLVLFSCIDLHNLCYYLVCYRTKDVCDPG